MAATRDEVTESLDAFKFSEPLGQLYHFFWNDFCDWYLEWVKSRMRDEQSKAIAQNVLAFVLDCTLRLLHPFIPFITEGIYQKLNEMAPVRELQGLVASRPRGSSHHRPLARQPRPLERPSRSKSRSSSSRKLSGRFATSEASTTSRRARSSPPRSMPRRPSADAMRANSGLICQLAGLGELPDRARISPKPNNAATAIVEGTQVYVHNVIDPEAERARLEKQKQEIEQAKKAVEGKLANANFVAKAKPRSGGPGPGEAPAASGTITGHREAPGRARRLIQQREPTWKWKWNCRGSSSTRLPISR